MLLEEGPAEREKTGTGHNDGVNEGPNLLHGLAALLIEPDVKHPRLRLPDRTRAAVDRDVKKASCRSIKGLLLHIVFKRCQDTTKGFSGWRVKARW